MAPQTPWLRLLCTRTHHTIYSDWIKPFEACVTDISILISVADPGAGAVWGNCLPKRLWRPVKIAPLWFQCAPFLVLNEVEIEPKIILNKQCFALRWTSRFTCRTLTQPLVDWNQQCYSFVIMLLFRVRTAQQSQMQSLSVSLAQFWTCRWAV